MAKVFLEEKEMRNLDKTKAPLYFLSFAFILLFPLMANAQRYEIGIVGGGGNYTGDLNPTFRFENYRPAGGIFGRYNFSQITSAKIFVNGVQAKGSDKYYSDPFPQMRGLHFIRTILEFGGQIEYNFFNYRDEKSRRNWTPYFFAGFGGMYMFDQLGRSAGKAKKIQPIIPTGVGFRYMVAPKWNLGLEVGARKTFTDYFDHLSDDSPEKFTKGNKFDRDWYFVTTLSLSYTFYTIQCPFNNYN